MALIYFIYFFALSVSLSKSVKGKEKEEEGSRKGSLVEMRASSLIRKADTRLLSFYFGPSQAQDDGRRQFPQLYWGRFVAVVVVDSSLVISAFNFCPLLYKFSSKAHLTGHGS